MRASEMRTMSRTPCASSFFGIGSMPHSGMPGPPSGPACCSTSTESAVTGSAGSSIRAVHVVVVAEHDGRPACWSSRGSAAVCLMTAPSGARLPRSTATPPSGADSARSRGDDHLVVEHARAGDVLAERAAVHGVGSRGGAGRASLVQQRAAARRRSRSPPSGTRPTGRMLASNGVGATARRSRSRSSATPARPAMAMR